jgi:hypothetical protein
MNEDVPQNDDIHGQHPINILYAHLGNNDSISKPITPKSWLGLKAKFTPQIQRAVYKSNSIISF